ncbi:MAG TPA: glycosyltransferase family 2 protein [Acetobacteraceae bacterium]|nr:glycosyltransferase family 2 protein [Acetobacteraceae bacterium]
MNAVPSPAPRVSVLVTTHNGAPWLGATLDSVLAQDFRDFELVVVDDASTDRTPVLLAGYAARDHRVRVLTAPRNLGVVGARNHGFAACRGENVALLDHDDLSRPGRLGAQVAHLDAHPEVVLLGTGVMVDTDGRLRPDPPAPCDPLGLRWALHLGNPLTWSSVMLRGTVARRLRPFLRAEYEYADDFDLYHRMLGLGAAARLDAPLTVYRWHRSNTTHREAGPLFDRAVAVLARAYRLWLGTDAADGAALAVRHLSHRQPVRDLATLDRVGQVCWSACSTASPQDFRRPNARRSRPRPRPLGGTLSGARRGRGCREPCDISGGDRRCARDPPPRRRTARRRSRSASSVRAARGGRSLRV